MCVLTKFKIQNKINNPEIYVKRERSHKIEREVSKIENYQYFVT